MVTYLSGERIQGSSAKVPDSSPNTGWKVLGRAVFDSNNPDDLDTGTFAIKDNLMILLATVSSTTIHPKLQFNEDTGNNYTFRYLATGTSSGGETSPADHIRMANGTNSRNAISVINVRNNASKEKLVDSFYGYTEDAGSAFTPQFEESWGTWTRTSGSGTGNASASITSVQVNNAQNGNYLAGTEVIVLGCDDDEADSGTNFWQQLAHKELTSTGGSFSVNFTGKKFIWFQFYTKPTGTSEPRIRIGWTISGTPTIRVSSGEYLSLSSANGADATATGGTTNMCTTISGSSSSQFMSGFLLNMNGFRHLILYRSINYDSAGNNAVQRRYGIGKLANSDGFVTTIEVFENTGNSVLGAGSYLTVWGGE